MAVLAATNTDFTGGQGVIRHYNFASINIDGADTFAGPSSPLAFWGQSTANPTTNTSAGMNVTESGGTYTFYPGIDNLSGTLFVVL